MHKDTILTLSCTEPVNVLYNNRGCYSTTEEDPVTRLSQFLDTNCTALHSSVWECCCVVSETAAPGNQLYGGNHNFQDSVYSFLLPKAVFTRALHNSLVVPNILGYFISPP